MSQTPGTAALGGGPTDPGHPVIPDGPAIPARLAARCRDARRGLPIPPVNVHPDPTGGGWHVDFTTINTTTATDLAVQRRCSLCGERMGYWWRSSAVPARPS